MIASFCQAHPEIELEIAASDEMVDLAAGRFDAGIRLGQFIAPDMVVVPLTRPFPFVVVGSPGYLAAHGRPARLEELRHHACLRLRRSNGAIAPWSFIDGNKEIEAIVSGPLIAHDYPTLLGRRCKASGWPGAWAAHQSADCRRPVASAPDALRRHDTRGFSLTRANARSCQNCAHSSSTSRTGSLSIDRRPCRPQSRDEAGTYVNLTASSPIRSLATRRSGGRGPAKKGLPRPSTTGRK